MIQQARPLLTPALRADAAKAGSKLPHSKEFSTCNAAWPRIQQQARVSRGCFHLRATMSQHDLRVLRGEFTSSQTSAVHRKQAGDVREFVQQRNHLCVGRPSNVEINVQQLGSAELSRTSIRRDDAQTGSELKESASAVNRDSGPGTCALNGTGDIGLLIPPSFISALYFQSVLTTGLVDRIVQRSKIPHCIRFALPKPSRAAVLAFQNFYNFFARP